MNWQAVKQRVVEWAVVGLIGGTLGAWVQLQLMNAAVTRHERELSECRAMKTDVALQGAYVDILWEESRRKR